MLKKVLVAVVALAVVAAAAWFFGRSYIVQYNQDWLSEYAADAVAKDASEALWECLTPAMQEESLRAGGNDVKNARQLILKEMKDYAAECDIDPEELVNNPDLRSKFANRLKSKSVFVKVNGKWYLGKKD